MPRGQVSASGEAVTTVDVLDIEGQPHTFEVIVDTGFDGHLTLPAASIARLGLPSIGPRMIHTASGEETFDLHSGVVSWHGRSREVPVVATDTPPLIGMGLLWGSRVTFDAVAGGALAIDDLTGAP